MGRDVSGMVANGSPEKTEKDDPVLNGSLVDGCKEKQSPIAERIIEAEVQNLSEMNGNSVHSDHANGTKKNGSAVKDLPKLIDSHSPDQERKMEPSFGIVAGKQPYHVTKSHYDEEDNWSLASSTAASIHATKVVTVAVAPRFTCVDRLERRKEFYSKLEEKHRALEKEKHEYQSRIKEEEEAAIKLLRKNMSYKANPVPNFYREGPPAKVELKKLPVTRPKSPNLTRRKSCGDAITKSSTPEKLPCGRSSAAAARHSIGSTKEVRGSYPFSSKSNRTQNGSPSPNGSTKVRSHRARPIKETNIKGKSNADIAVAS